MPLLFLPQLFDGVSFSYIFETKNFSSLKLWYIESSRHFHLLFFYIILFLSTYTFLPTEIIFDIFALIFLVLLCIEVRIYSKFLFHLENKWANLAAIFTAIFPVWHTLVAINITLYLVSFFFLFFGYRNFISNNKIKIVIGFVSLFISFNVESNLCFVIGLALIHLILSKVNKKINFTFFKFITVIFASVLYYFLKEFLFPPFGFWEGYNKITLQSILSNLSNPQFINNIYNFLTYLIYYLWLPVIFLLHLFLVNKNFSIKNINLKKINNYYLLILLSFFATFPYLIVNSFVPSLFYLADYYQRHAFPLSFIFGIFFALMFRDINKINNFRNKVNINLYIIIFISFNLILLNYGNLRKTESYLFKKNLINELKTFESMPKGNVELVAENFPSDLRFFEINHIFYKAYNTAGWWGKKDKPTQRFLIDKRYSVNYIFNNYENECSIRIYFKNTLNRIERMKKFYIFNYKKYYNIDKITKKC